MIWMCKSSRLVDQSTNDAKRLKMEIKINHTVSWSAGSLFAHNRQDNSEYLICYAFATRYSFFIFEMSYFTQSRGFD